MKQRLHAKKRAKERYGLDFTTKDLKEMVRLIQEKPKKGAVKISRESCRITIWRLTYNGVEIPVAFDTRSQTIASVLPPHVLYPEENKDEVR